MSSTPIRREALISVLKDIINCPNTPIKDLETLVKSTPHFCYVHQVVENLTEEILIFGGRYALVNFLRNFITDKTTPLDNLEKLTKIYGKIGELESKMKR